VGKSITLVKRLVLRAVRWYVHAGLEKQADFNAAVTRFGNEWMDVLQSQIDENARLSDEVTGLRERLAALEDVLRVGEASAAAAPGREGTK
jgi:hypothetical protein